MVSQATSAQTSSSIQVVSSHSSLGLPNPPSAISNIKGFVPIELTYLNYLTWKKVFLAVLKSHNLLPLVDGSIPCLSSTNDGYRLWISCDTITLSWINVILSPPVLDHFSIIA
uniref:Retrotransposon Copia-like N-terminal domain-containing protein n=1 Tax=Solanum lycopersicum TaxID=4081 RepID=A0A3Q7EAL2_SOLLC